METLKFILILVGTVTAILVLWHLSDIFEKKYGTTTIYDHLPKGRR